MQELPSGLTLRDYSAADAPAVLRLNAANVPEVGPLTDVKLAALAASAWWLPVAVQSEEVVGFAILLTEGADYASPNYRWFSDRHARFGYVDRIAIAESARGFGLGRAIYGRARERAAIDGRAVLCAEVNTVPPNEASLRFHRRFGFEEVARTRPYEPEFEVAMLECATGSDR